MATPTTSAAASRIRPSPVLIGIGILVLALGFGIPQVLPVSLSPSTGSEKEATPSESPNLIFAVFRMFGSLAVVCVLCILVSRMMGKRKVVDAGNMEVLASLALEAQCGVYLVRAGERRLVLGIDATGVKTMVELSRSMVEPVVENLELQSGAVSQSASVPDRDVVAELLTHLRAAA